MASSGAGIVRHMVQLKVGNKSDIPLVAERLGTIKDALKDVKILSFTVVLDLETSETNADVGVIADFPDKETYLAYAKHPEHLAVVASNKPLVTGRSAMQWTVPSKI